MAVTDYSYTGGISPRALDEARKRRAQRSAYSPSISGLSELDTERDVNNAATSDGDVQAAADPRRISAMLRAPMSDLSVAQRPEGQSPYALREPMTGAPEAMRPAIGIDLSPGPERPEVPAQKTAAPSTYVDPLDAQDRAQSERIRRQRLGLVFAGLAGDIFGDPATSQQRNAAVQGALGTMDPSAPLANIDARAQTRREQDEANRRMAIEDEERALEGEYRRTLMRSMDVNADRREFEMSRRGTQDERLYDPTSPTAASYRSALARVIASHPLTQAAFGSLDTSQMGARDLQGLADRVLRLRSQIPNRDRGVDDDELASIIAGMDAQGAPPAEAAPEVVEETPRARAESIARRNRGQAAPAAAPTAPAPAGILDRRGQPAPWAGRGDRTVAQMNAESIIEREPQARSWAEALAAARALERSRTREAGALAGGVDTRSREAQFQQTQQTGTFTEQDVTRAARIMQPIQRQSRQLRGLLARVDQISDADFRQAMQGGLAALGFNASDFQSQWAAYSNPELRERSGAAVTDHEYQRFVQEFNAGRLNSREQFKRALSRVLAEVQANSRTFGLRPDVVEEVRRRGRPQGGR